MQPKELMHYGKKGMRWGRKSSKQPLTSKQKAKILKSPSKTYKNMNRLSKEEIDGAINKFRMQRELKTLSRDKLSEGSKFANAILAYGAVATAAYGLYKSPLGDRIKKEVVKRQASAAAKKAASAVASQFLN